MTTERPAEAQAKSITAYKGFDKYLKCRGFQFEVGKTYEHSGDVKACESGFHACENPLDVWNYYGPCESLFARVELSGSLARHSGDSKIAAAVLQVSAELSLPQFISDAIDYIKRLCSMPDAVPASGNYSKLAASGHSSQLAASGHYSQLAASGDSSQLAASGHYSQLAASGNYSKLAASGRSSQLAASGHYSQLAASGHSSQLAASGHYSQLAASGGASIAMASASNCSASVGERGCIVLARWVESEKRYRVSVGYVGENIRSGVLYRLDDEGGFVEVA